MSLHPQAEQLLQRLAEAGTPPVHEMSPTEAREAHAEQTEALAGSGPEVGEVRDKKIPTAAGGLQVRTYRPEGAGPFPVVVYLHGGGWIVGTLDSYDALCRHLALRTDCLVVSVAYRRAPEHHHPAAFEDAYTATCWAHEHAASFDGDPRSLGIAGDSAGGHLAALVAVRAHERDHPALRFQVLIYPALDPTMGSESINEFAEGYYLTRAELRWCWNRYLGPGGWELSEVTPLHRARLDGLPPTLLIVAGHDPLRDEGVSYAKRLAAAGVFTRLRNYEGMIHGFVRFLRVLDAAHDALDDVADFVREVVRSPQRVQNRDSKQGRPGHSHPET